VVRSKTLIVSLICSRSSQSDDFVSEKLDKARTTLYECSVNDTDIAQQVIDQCLAKGVREFVVCSGARNLPLISALVRYEDVVIWSHFEERAAGFYALGRMMDTREPCAVITTSGTAVAELLPSVVESFYQGRPLLVISADRPSSYRNSGAPQAIEQPGMFGNYVGRCVDIEHNVASLFDGWSGRQPWHLNVCLDEEVTCLERCCHLFRWPRTRGSASCIRFS